MDEDNGDHIGKAEQKSPGNRRNAQLSTRTRTEQGRVSPDLTHLSMASLPPQS